MSMSHFLTFSVLRATFGPFFSYYVQCHGPLLGHLFFCNVIDSTGQWYTVTSQKLRSSMNVGEYAGNVKFDTKTMSVFKDRKLVQNLLFSEIRYRKVFMQYMYMM